MRADRRYRRTACRCALCSAYDNEALTERDSVVVAYDGEGVGGGSFPAGVTATATRTQPCRIFFGPTNRVSGEPGR
jgi:hypothetical protein